MSTSRMRAGLLAGAAIALTGAVASAQYSVGDQWLRAADFVQGVHGSTSGNPGPGFDGAPVWRYELATGGGGLASADPWYRRPTQLMTWDRDWWGIGEGAWSAGDNTNPPVFRDRMTHNIIGSHFDKVPLVRWENPSGDGMQVSLAGQYSVLWSGNMFVGDSVDVELVVARERALTGDFDVLFSRTISKPTPGPSIGDRVDVPVDLRYVELDQGDSLIFSGRATDRKSGLGRWVVISDQIAIEVVPVPAPGALAVLGLAGLAATRRRR